MTDGALQSKRIREADLGAAACSGEHGRRCCRRPRGPAPRGLSAGSSRFVWLEKLPPIWRQGILLGATVAADPAAGSGTAAKGPVASRAPFSPAKKVPDKVSGGSPAAAKGPAELDGGLLERSRSRSGSSRTGPSRRKGCRRSGRLCGWRMEEVRRIRWPEPRRAAKVPAGRRDRSRRLERVPAPSQRVLRRLGR